jgi:tetratricopeptide (TPR) repeat protein
MSNQSLSNVLSLSDSDVDQIAAFGAALYAENKLESAARIFEGLTTLFPARAEYWTAFGAVLTRLQRYEQGVAILTTALRMNPKDTAAMVNRAECYIALADNEKAAGDLEKAMKLDPKMQDPASNRARQLAFGMYSFFQQCVEQGLNEVEVGEETF